MVKRDKTVVRSLILRQLVDTPIVSLAVIMLLCSAGFAIHKLYQTQVIAPWNQNVLTELDVKTYLLAKQISDYFVELQVELKHVAQLATLNQPLHTGGQSSLRKIQNNLQKKWPALNEATLLKNSEQYAQTSENFIAFVQIYESKAGKYPAPVAAKLNGVWVIYIATPVFGADNQSVTGSLLTIFSTDILKASIEQNQPNTGVSKILQTSEGFEPQIIYSSGSTSSSLGKVVPIGVIKGWQLSYTAADTLAPNTPKSMKTFLSSLTGIILVTTMLIGLLIRNSERISSIFDSDLAKRIKNAPPDLSPEELNKLVADKLSSIRAPSKKAKLNTTHSDKPGDPEKYPTVVFRDYDIRGRAGTQINILFAEVLGKTLGSNALTDQQTSLAVAADGRTTSPELHEALVKGVLSTGCNVIDLGCIPTPVFNFGIQSLTNVTSGVIVTASHSPAEDNGFKIIIDQQVMSPEHIKQLAKAMAAEQWAEGNGGYNQQSVGKNYRDAISQDITISRPIQVVVDCANGVMGNVAPQLLETIGCEVIPLYCDVDGNFPHHPPDPSNPNNLKDLVAVVAHGNADLGLAFDGDGDRLVAVSATGRIVWPDELLMIYARDLLSRQPDAPIVYDIKSTRRLESLVSSYGGHPIMCKTGHSNVRRQILEAKAPLGGEYSGHIFFSDRWFGFDDGLYAAARLIEIMDLREQTLDQIIDSFETTVATPEIKVAVPDDKKFELIKKIAKNTTFKGATLNHLDGLRVDFPNGWGLIRASNTSASMTLRFEADNKEALDHIQECFREQISPIIPDITLAF